MKVVLIGFMGSGKSSVGKLLAQKTKLKFIETDEIILKETGFDDMAKLFATRGEVGLREAEIQLAKRLFTLNDVVIATGGGMVLNKINLDYLRKNGGLVIFLKTQFSEIVKRLKTDPTPRPLFAKLAAARAIFTFRKALYTQYADLIINTDNKNQLQIVSEIYEHLRHH